jgi:hypothetical protein
MLNTLEKRRPRASFTRVLARFCARLDSNSIIEVSVPEGRYRPAYSGTVRMKSLAVVGSYARGAATCGDLDLLLDFELLDGGMPPLRLILRKLFGSPPDVRIYHGSQETNSSGIAFGDYVHLWAPGSDWRAALTSIKIDTGATKARHGDEIPLRIEQVDADLAERQRLTELKAQGLLQWRLLPYEVGEKPEPLNEMQAHIKRVASHSWGRKNQALLPGLLRYFGTRHDCLIWQCASLQLEMAGVVAKLGYRQLDESLLDSVNHARILIAPHISRRGPNALWEIERGPLHPLELAFADCQAYVLCNPNGTPELVTELFCDGWGKASLLELFPTADAAVGWDNHLKAHEDQNEPSSELRPVALRGRALLDLLSYADIAEVTRGTCTATWCDLGSLHRPS